MERDRGGRASSVAGVAKREHFSLPVVRTSVLGSFSWGEKELSGWARLGLLSAASKRAFDIVVSGAVLLFTLPLLGLIAILIRLDSRGPVIVGQRRVGRGAKPFRLLEFRTMVDSAVDGGSDLTAGNNPRITRVGRYLRLSQLDKLPSFINVLTGSMSLVGPRAESVDFLPYYSEKDRVIFDVRPGLTDRASLELRANGNGVADSDDPEHVYINEILPKRLRMTRADLGRGLAFDVRILVSSLASIISDLSHHSPFARVGRWFLSNRRAFIILVHVALFAGSFAFSFLLRFDLLVPARMQTLFWSTLPILIGVRFLAFGHYRLYHGLWRYFSIWDLIALTKAVTLSSVVFAALLMLSVEHTFPRSVLVLDWLLCLAFTAGVRMSMRVTRELTRTSIGEKNALIVGAGDAGEMLAREIERGNPLDYELVGFVDDDATLRGHQIHGLPVLGRVEELPEICRKFDVHEVLIAIPSAGTHVHRRVLDFCREAGVVPKTVPTLGDLLRGRARIGQLQDVQPEDLLGRHEVTLDADRVRAELENKTVLVTGAAGSIGSELCRQITRFRPKKLVLYERAESALYFLASELGSKSVELQIVPVVGDILDHSLLNEILQAHRPDVIYHAAAYKHVPLMEDQPIESIRNNVFGTEAVALAAIGAGVKKFVLISTDKAVRPVGVMGMTKNAAEQLLQSFDAGPTVFTAVRFGNVLGSNGSVIPLFQRQIAMGGPVTVTHPEATRYFMLISEAAQLVLQAGVMGVGGDVFFLNMGEPMRIMDIANNLIRLSGLSPHEDVPVEVIGLRPGERLSEELVMAEEELGPSEHEKVFRVARPSLNVTDFTRELELLRCSVDERRHSEALTRLKHIVDPQQTQESREDSVFPHHA
jgi:FlaA1/EpsC-like NDP-sugar epimerase/lipopolysaccharide/colanic/teichoic acid biosynthesis glycosyltransferase